MTHPRDCATCRHGATPTARNPQCRDCYGPEWPAWEKRVTEGVHEGTVQNTRYGVFVDVPRWWAGRRVRVTLLPAGKERAWRDVVGKEPPHD